MGEAPQVSDPMDNNGDGMGEAPQGAGLMNNDGDMAEMDGYTGWLDPAGSLAKAMSQFKF